MAREADRIGALEKAVLSLVRPAATLQGRWRTAAGFTGWHA